MNTKEKPAYSDQQTRDLVHDSWLTASALIEQTGISKRDLIRFIQLKALPKSMMRVSPTGRDGARKKSYFSKAALAHVVLLKQLREEGHSVETVAAEMRRAAKALPSSPHLSASSAQTITPAKETRAGDDLHLPTAAITTPAFLVDHHLRIAWIKVDPNNRLSRAMNAELKDDPSGTVFDIMLRASLKELVFNWQPLFTFAYRYLQAHCSVETFNRLAPMVSLNPEKTDRPETGQNGEARTIPIDSCPILIEEDDGRMQDMRMYALAVSEGTLFILDKARWQDDYFGDRAVAPDAALRSEAESTAEKTPFSVLSARLDDSRSIVDTLLPETYFQLMTRIWDETDAVLSAYGGHRAKRSGTEVQYIIPRHADTDPAFDAICCAVELKEKMREVEQSLKVEGGWFNDIRLNIGISSGRDHLQQEDPTASMAFMLPGGAADQAFHLSAIAHGGAIWITKSAFSHLSPELIKRITFGIYRDERLIPNIFAPISELPHAPGTPPPGRGIRALSVTRIIALRSEHNGQPHR